MKDTSLNLIFGRNPIKEALRSGRVINIYLLKGFNDKSVLSLIDQNKVKVTYLLNPELDKMCNNAAHQGVIAEIKPYSYCSIEEILIRSKEVEHPIVVLLDGINDPHNFGAILRSCDVFGVVGVIIPKHNQVMLNATVAKTSAGAINFVRVCLVSNLNNAIKTLKENGYWVVASDGFATSNYDDIKYDFPTALVVGSEGEGVSPLIVKNSDFVIKIPMWGKVNSLNASVATGILLSRIKSHK